MSDPVLDPILDLALDPTLDTASSTTTLLQAAAAGHPQAWRQLMDRYDVQVNATIRTFRLQEADARDAAQATWLRLVEHHGSIRQPESLGGWLRTSARRECLRIIRERSGTDLVADSDVLNVPDGAADLAQSVVDADAARRLSGLVDRLPARSAALIRGLFTEAPPSYTELARRCGVPIGSIGPTRARALRTLRALFEAGEPRVLASPVLAGPVMSGPVVGSGAL
jgi:RNA polymerase sigma factor (sigma-70 family)